MLKNKKTFYQLILDKSGSMNNCTTTTINGFNEQMQMIRSMKNKYPEQEFFVSLTTFNEYVQFDIDQEDPENIKDLIMINKSGNCLKSEDKVVYHPNGMTALYDAIGMSVKRIQEQANEDICNDYATVVVVIITDGHENSSQKYSYEQIQSIIKGLEESDNWTFSYLSNTPDAVEYAMNMNIRKENAIRYQKQALEDNYQDICHSLDNYFEKKQRNIKEKEFIKSKREK